MTDDPRIEPRRKLVCLECGYWCDATMADDGLVPHCGQQMVETWRDPAFLNLDWALRNLGRALVEALRLEQIVEWLSRKVERLTRRWRRTDA